MIEFENKKMINKFLNGTPHRLHLETKQIEKTYKKGPLSQTITISAYLQSTPYVLPYLIFVISFTLAGFSKTKFDPPKND